MGEYRVRYRFGVKEVAEAVGRSERVVRGHFKRGVAKEGTVDGLIEYVLRMRYLGRGGVED